MLPAHAAAALIAAAVAMALVAEAKPADDASEKPIADLSGGRN